MAARNRGTEGQSAAEVTDLIGVMDNSGGQIAIGLPQQTSDVLPTIYMFAPFTGDMGEGNTTPDVVFFKLKSRFVSSAGDNAITEHIRKLILEAANRN